MNWICHCMSSFLSYYGDCNMSNDSNDPYFEAWSAVWDTLMKGNPIFSRHPETGMACAVREIKRLQEAEKHRVGEAEAWKAAHARVLGERNNMIDQRDFARHEREGESRNKNAALHELDKEREKHTETLKLLEKERATSGRLGRELAKSRDELARAQSPLPPTMGGGADTHRQYVRQAVQRFARNDTMTFANHPRRVAEAVYYLLERDAQQTAAVKRLSERLDALEPNKKQAANQCAQGFSPAPWEVQQQPSGGFNPG
jgi:hypothetical protein